MESIAFGQADGKVTRGEFPDADPGFRTATNAGFPDLARSCRRDPLCDVRSVCRRPRQAHWGEQEIIQFKRAHGEGNCWPDRRRNAYGSSQPGKETGVLPAASAICAGHRRRLRSPHRADRRRLRQGADGPAWRKK